MTLDLPTLVALTALSAFLMGALISLANRTQATSDPSMGILGINCLFQSLGWLLIGFREQIPLTISVLGSNLAFLASALCYLQAVNVFIRGAVHEQKSAVPPLHLVLAAVCALYCFAIAYFWWFAPQVTARMMATSIVQSFIHGLCAARLLSVRPLCKSRLIVGVGSGVIAVLHCGRLVKLRLDPPRVTDLASLYESQTVTLIFGHIAVVMLTFLFVLMVHDRVCRDLRELVTLDYLTGTFNRSAFEGFARQGIEQARRSGQPLALVLFDVDHFKTINDTLGHLTGDVALRALTQVSAQNLRSQDILGRYGGEEFAVLLPATDAQGALLVAERIRESVAEAEFRDDGAPFRLTISVGIAALSLSGSLGTEQRLTALFRAADAALYEAKRSGRNRTLIAPAEATG